MLLQFSHHSLVAFAVGMHMLHRDCQRYRVVDDVGQVVAALRLSHFYHFVVVGVGLGGIFQRHVIVGVDIKHEVVKTTVARCDYFSFHPECKVEKIAFVLHFQLHVDIAATNFAFFSLLEECVVDNIVKLLSANRHSPQFQSIGV